MANASLERILMVEDEPHIQEVSGMAMEVVGGFAVTMCSSGEEALRPVSEFAPDLILLDVTMGGMDGPTTLQALRALPSSAQTPVIFMTAKVQPHEVARYKALGALDAISKPFDPMTLSEQLQTIWTRHMSTRNC